MAYVMKEYTFKEHMFLCLKKVSNSTTKQFQLNTET